MEEEGHKSGSEAEVGVEIVYHAHFHRGDRANVVKLHYDKPDCWSLPPTCKIPGHPVLGAETQDTHQEAIHNTSSGSKSVQVRLLGQRDPLMLSMGDLVDGQVRLIVTTNPWQLLTNR